MSSFPFHIITLVDVTISPELILHHLSEMMAGFSTRKERTKLTQCTDLVDLIDLLESQWQIKRIADN